MEEIKAYIGLGTNLGDRERNIQQAVDSLRKTPGIQVKAQSKLLETDPIGKIEQPKFINCVVEIHTSLTPEALMEACLRIEKDMGRVRLERWGPRLIDLDILLFGNESIHQKGLTIPHPEISNRSFVQEGLKELCAHT